jgi:hypothetical protein
MKPTAFALSTEEALEEMGRLGSLDIDVGTERMTHRLLPRGLW